MATKKPVPIGKRIDALFALREQKRQLEAQVKVIEEKIDAESRELMEELDKQGMQKATGTAATVSVTEAVVANIVDWDALCAYVKRKGYFHLFQRRVSDPAARELFEAEGKVPGLEPYTKRKLNLTKIAK